MTLRPGTLWGRIVRQTERAVRERALYPIRTDQRFVEEGGVRFVVRVASSLARKAEERAKRGKGAEETGTPANPFLPYDRALFVGDLSDTHVCLLNKFNVIDHHLLIVTRAFEHQETLMTPADFRALWACMAEFEGLGFYNGGARAGASQDHKHVQIVPLPLAGEGPPIPIEPLLPRGRRAPANLGVPAFPFLAAFAELDPRLATRPPAAAEAAHERYHAMLKAVGLGGVRVGDEVRQSAPYNLLLAREWMLLVPRSRERFESVSVNALGFAGSLFVRDEREMRIIVDHGPMTVLSAVAVTEARAARPAPGDGTTEPEGESPAV